MRARLVPLAAAHAALALAAALATPRGAADAEEHPSVTTVLRPGWNMAAWLGEDAPAQAIFDAVPEIAIVLAWDAEARRYRSASPRAAPLDWIPLAMGFPTPASSLALTTGAGLWLYVVGGASVEWVREPSRDSVLLEMRAGRNLVSWTGRDGIPAARAFARFRAPFVRASRWNAEARRSEEYRYSRSIAENTLLELRRGDAFWVELTSDARWWQPGAAPSPVEFLGDVPVDEQDRIRRWVDETQAVYAELWGIKADFASYVGDLDSITPIYASIWGGPPSEDFCGGYGYRVVFVRVDCISSRTYPHEYFHVLQDDLSGGRDIHVPTWLIEGSAGYAEVIQQGLVSVGRTADEHFDRDLRSRLEALSRTDLPALSSIEGGVEFHGYGLTAYDLGFVAVHRLAERSTPGAIVDFFRTLRTAASWREAFETAFGISAKAFYEDFEPYIREVATPAPLEFLGDIPGDTQTAIRSEYGRVKTFFAQRFGAETPRFTAYVGADAEAVKATHQWVFGEPPAAGFCEHSIHGVAAVVVLACGDPPLHNLDRHYFNAVRAQSAPWESLPPVPAGHNPLGPDWLLLATEHYAEYAYRQGLGVQETLYRIRDEHVSLAAQTDATLHSMETRRGVDAAGYWGVYGLTHLAAERLVRRAGEPALFAYYRALPDAADWREAFEAAFGIGAEAFYADFEEYRAEIAPLGG